MSVSVSMPQLGESVTEGTVTRWLKKEGERVEADEPLLEVSTDKVDTEIPSPVAGILRGITVAEDETVAVGAELAVIDENGAQAPAEGDAGAGPQAQAEPAAPGRCCARARRTRYSPRCARSPAPSPRPSRGTRTPRRAGTRAASSRPPCTSSPAAYEAVGYGSPGAADPESVEEPPAAPAPDQGQPAGAPQEQAAAAAPPVSDIWQRSEPAPTPPAQAPGSARPLPRGAAGSGAAGPPRSRLRRPARRPGPAGLAARHGGRPVRHPAGPQAGRRARRGPGHRHRDRSRRADPQAGCDRRGPGPA